MRDSSDPNAGDCHLRDSRVWLIALMLATVTFLLYFPTKDHDFLKMDDPDYVVLNPRVNTGLSLSNVAWAFTQSHSSNWHPITWISHMIDCQLFGLKPGPHHLVNAALHALNSVLLLLLLRVMTGSTWRSTLVACLFAWHPLHVESVAWIAERKDVLSTFFWFLTTWAYVCYTRSDSQKRRLYYGAALALFAMGLMSKPMLVTLPCTLLLLDYWPLNRFSWRDLKTHTKATLLPLFYEKAPFFLLAAASSVVTFQAQSGSGAVMSDEALPTWFKVTNALLSYFKYLELTFVPHELSVFYPLNKELTWIHGVGALLGLLFITAVAVRFAAKHPFALVGWFWFLGTLVPVIGFIKAGEQAIADRYTYVPLIGIFLVLAWGAHRIALRGRTALVSIGCITATLLALCLSSTRQQIPFWRNSSTLYSHALSVEPNNYLAMTVLGGILWSEGRLTDAKEMLDAGLRLAPQSPDLHTWSGFVLVGSQEFAEALSHFEQALAGLPKHQPAIYGKAFCLFNLNQPAEALHFAQLAWQIEETDVKAGLLVALAQKSLSRFKESAETCQKVLVRKPDWVPALNTLAGTLAADGSATDAIEIYGKALTIEPTNIEALNGLADALWQDGQLEESRARFKESLGTGPRQAETRLKLAALEKELNNLAGSIQEYRTVLGEYPDSLAGLNNLAWILATTPDLKYRDSKEALRLAQLACELSHSSVPLFLGTLAAAHAASGDFPAAVSAATRARELALAEGNQALAERNEELLELYRAEKAYLETR